MITGERDLWINPPILWRSLFALVALVVIGVTGACVGVPAGRPYVNFSPDDYVAVGVAAYDSGDPSAPVEGGFLFAIVPLGSFDVVGNLQLDFSEGLRLDDFGGGGSLSTRFRFRPIPSIELVPELSFSYLKFRLPQGFRDQAALVLVDLSVRFRFTDQVWAYIRPGAGAGAAVYGNSLGGVFPALRLSYGAQWEVNSWLRLTMEGNVATEIGGVQLALGILTVL